MYEIHTHVANLRWFGILLAKSVVGVVVARALHPGLCLAMFKLCHHEAQMRFDSNSANSSAPSSYSVDKMT